MSPGKRRAPVRRRAKAGGGGRRLLLVVVAVLVAGIFAAGYWLGRGGNRPPSPAAAAVTADASTRREAERAAHEESHAADAAAGVLPAETPYAGTGGAGSTDVPPPPPAGPGNGARIAIVIDDLGRSLADLDTIRDFGVPISYAVLPFESMTPQVVDRLRERKVEILLHLPMEPSSSADPGPGALHAGMEPAEIRRRTEEALGAVPGAMGVNNHMGSELSAEPRAMRAVLDVVGEHGLYYLDSRTTAESVGYETALELGVPAAERQVFLDDELTVPAVVAQFRRLLDLARERGAAIAIGHPHPATLRALREEIPKARAAGYEFVPVSFLVDRPNGAPE